MICAIDIYSNRSGVSQFTTQLSNNEQSWYHVLVRYKLILHQVKIENEIKYNLDWIISMNESLITLIPQNNLYVKMKIRFLMSKRMHWY